MENDAPYLPQEIIRNILVQLPAKSLIQFQCVCKDWKNLFKTPSFIEEHLHHSSKQNPSLVVGCIITECNPWYLCLLNHEMQVIEFQSPPMTDCLMCYLGMVFSSNGLLCVEITSRFETSFWLWNPSIREVRQVPKPPNNYECEYSYVGFGFSPIVNDYKIVKLVRTDYLVNRVEVYSLRTRLWRKVELGDLEGVYVSGHRGFTCNGVIFWFGQKEESERDLIISFDIAMEVFTIIPLPTSHALCLNTLTIHENKLAMLSFCIIGDYESSLIDLWVMEECIDSSGDKQKWTKIYTCKPSRYLLSPEVIWRNEIVCRVEGTFESGLKNHGAEVLLCDITTNEFNMFDIPESRRNRHPFFDYVESLVLLDSIHT